MPIVNVVGIVTSLIIFTLGTAVAMIALWQDRSARNNQLLALTMFGLGLWGLPNGLYYVAFQYELDIQFWINNATLFYLFAEFFFLIFVTELKDPQEQQLALRVRLVAILLLALIAVLTLANLMWTDPILNQNNTYEFRFSLIGTLILAIIGGFIFWSVMQLKNSAIANNRQFINALIPAPLGLVLFMIFGAPFGHLLNGVMVVISMVMTARIVFNDKLFNPLIEMYDELTTKNAELERASKRKSEFLANMSHELRTPLNSIIGYTELVLNGIYGTLEERQSDRLQKVHRNGRELLVLINDVLDLSKIDAGRMELIPQRLPPGPLIDDVISTLNELATSKSITIDKKYSDLPMLYVDEMRARQIILNILANVLKFTKENNRVEISGYYDAVRNQVVLTTRAKSGAISSLDSAKLQQAIQEDDDLPAKQFADFGLGLAVSRRLIEMHGGSLEYDTRSTTFQMSFPASSEIKKRSSITAKQLPIHVNEAPIILAIDDDGEAIEVLEGYLENENYIVMGALSGHEGLLRARELQPDLITLDMRMPGMDGWGVLDALQADETLKNIPVIVVSISDFNMMTSQMDNVVGYLTKPINRQHLLKKLSEILLITP